MASVVVLRTIEWLVENLNGRIIKQANESWQMILVMARILK
jgi:hypothetical protein